MAPPIVDRSVTKAKSPITANHDTTWLDSVPISELKHRWLQQVQFDISSEITGCATIDLYRCNGTGLEFFYPPEAAGSSLLYEHLQRHDWYYIPDKWEHDVTLNELQGWERVLEVGCGSGAFVHRLRQNGFDAHGIEINKSAVQMAQKRNLPVSLVSLYDMSVANPASFDVVCSFQVLEHVANPGEFIQQSVALLRKSGKLICSVPNADSFLRYHDTLLDMPPHHMSRWTASTFHALENFYDMRLDKCISEPLQRYHVDSYIAAQSRRFHSQTVGKLLFNRNMRKCYRALLGYSNIREQLTGQSLYAQFSKTK